MTRLAFRLSLALPLLGGACSLPSGLADDGDAPTGGAGLQVVSEGRADNYYSDVATEYEVSGSIALVLSPEEASDERMRNEVADARLSALGVYLTTLLSDKFESHDSNSDGAIADNEVFFHNVSYGGFHAMVRNRSFEVLEVTGSAEAGYRASFTVDVAGPSDLLAKLPNAEPSGDGVRFSLQMPKGATSIREFEHGGDIRSFNPADYPEDELETHVLTVRAHPAVRNAYPAYDAFVADRILDITFLFGHDYASARADLVGARAVFAKLKALGFTMPVERFEDLKPDSGAFTRAAGARVGNAEGRAVTVEVRLFHSDMYQADRSIQRGQALAELAARDVFVYAGHAGPYYGFYLDAADEAHVSEADLSNVEFTDKQQLFFARGCQTYSQYADLFYAHEKKDETNLDVITTVNFSYDAGLPELLEQLAHVDKWSYLSVPTYDSIIAKLNAYDLSKKHSVLYGVTGVDGNSRLHPFANSESIGRVCANDWDCGDHYGNICMQASESLRCGAVALGADACPAGTRFVQLSRASVIVGSACVK